MIERLGTHRRRQAPGTPPGTLVQRSDARPTRVVLRRFGPDVFEEAELGTLDEIARYRAASGCVWIEVTGLADTALVRGIGEAFHLSALSLEDVLDPTQRPKVEHFEDHSYVVVETLSMAERVEAQPLSLFFGEGFVVTLQDRELVSLAPIRDRLAQAHGKVRARGADYLSYALLDTVIDNYFPVFEAFDDHLERVEEAVTEPSGADPIALVRHARQNLQTIRRAVWPARDVLSSLLHEDTPRVTDETRLHLRDCYDHVVQLQELVEASREIAASLLEAYLSTVSLQTNEVMKLLTVIATIFIPLTFITSLYGMNFNPHTSPLNMPELHWYWGYPTVLAVMLAVAVGFLWFIRSRGWFDGRR